MAQFENTNSTMETRDHLKNGENPKSQRSRKNFKNYFLVFAMLVSCNYLNGQIIIGIRLADSEKPYIGQVISRQGEYDWVVRAGPYNNSKDVIAEVKKLNMTFYVKAQNGMWVVSEKRKPQTSNSAPTKSQTQSQVQAQSQSQTVVVNVNSQSQNSQPSQSSYPQLYSVQSSSGYWSVVDENGEYVTSGRAYKASGKFYNVEDSRGYWKVIDCYGNYIRSGRMD